MYRLANTSLKDSHSSPNVLASYCNPFKDWQWIA